MWAIDGYRFHSLDTPLVVIAIFVLVFSSKNRELKFIFLSIIFLYVVLSIKVLFDLYSYLKEIQKYELNGINTMKSFIEPGAIICTNHLNAPWILLDNPVSSLTKDIDPTFLNWKKCDYICLFNGKEWKIKHLIR